MDFKNVSPQTIARQVVFEYATAHLDKSDPPVPVSVYVVWFCFTLRNWKCLLSTTLNDGMYYEVTYDAVRNCVYLDAYKKFENVKIEGN